jgi:hypothetical protein
VRGIVWPHSAFADENVKKTRKNRTSASHELLTVTSRAVDDWPAEHPACIADQFLGVARPAAFTEANILTRLLYSVALNLP